MEPQGHEFGGGLSDVLTSEPKRLLVLTELARLVCSSRGNANEPVSQSRIVSVVRVKHGLPPWEIEGILEELVEAGVVRVDFWRAQNTKNICIVQENVDVFLEKTYNAAEKKLEQDRLEMKAYLKELLRADGAVGQKKVVGL